MQTDCVVNEGKNRVVEVGGQSYERLAIKTHVITDEDDICDVAEKYVTPFLQDGDVVFITEKAVACTQRRAIPVDQIKPRPLARFLCKFVYKNPHGIGLRMPETMEMALRECGTIRILFSASCSTKRDGSTKSRATRPAPSTARAATPCPRIIIMWCLVPLSRTPPRAKSPSVLAARRC